ncbi:MAG: hypothetical protein ACLP6G_12680 [Terriglobales bacterium]
MNTNLDPISQRRVSLTGSYFTTKVKTVLWVALAEPEVKVPVTVTE